jgi:exonuclease SbcC
MRPLRLTLDGFGSYRQPAEADFSDVDFFALTGPTGSGKSTLIDGLCFALYGTVPRWGKENAIADALAPAANACRVSLVFEAAGKRYAAVRALNRDKQGRVHTKEARLERLDAGVDPGAPLDKLLEASVEQLAEGPDPVTAQVEDILGLSYKHFTQSVLLPQGRFSEFLQAKATARQDLLVELLAFGVYEKVGQRARERARLAAERMRSKQAERDDLAGATAAAETQAAARLEALTGLARTVDASLAALRQVADQAEQAAQQARAAGDEIALLAAIRTPAEVPGLTHRITEADDLSSERAQRLTLSEKRLVRAEEERDRLPDKTQTELFRAGHQQRRQLAAQLKQQEQDLAGTQAAEAARSADLQAAERDLEQAQDAVTRAEREHAAVALAQHLTVGDDCPVCLQRVHSLPHHSPPADLTKAKAAAQAAARERKRALDAHAGAARAAAASLSTRDATRQQLDKLAAVLAEAPGEDEVTGSLREIAAADQALREARKDVAAARAAAGVAEKGRSSLDGEEQQAWARLRKLRDSVVALGAPTVEDAGLAAAWQTLSTWAAAEHGDRARRQPELDAAATALRQQVRDDTAGLVAQLAAHGITGVTDPARAATAVATHAAQAENDLKAVRRDRAKAAKLAEEIRARREEEQVATMLGQMLRASSFERWLCSEALDSLVAEASVTLMELSGNQYELARDERNELFVIDYQDAGSRRPVHTLSGGETFQASLALALALSRQVVGLSAGMRDLNSMFLDEGFGTLDEDTLETVATTLERLAADSDRMVGIITHVHALAERVPVRFIVSRTGATSVLRKERVS